MDDTGQNEKRYLGGSGGSISDVLKYIETMRADAQLHSEQCKKRPCERCDRWLCKYCSEPVDGAKTCDACEPVAQREALLSVTLSSIPPRYRWASGGWSPTLRARTGVTQERFASLLRNTRGNAVFVGASGAGKTSLAVALLCAWVAASPSERRGSVFVDASHLSRSRSRERLGSGESLDVRIARDCHLLLVDDLGCEQNDRDGALTDIVYWRSNYMRPTWFTSGIARNKNELIEKVGARYDGGFARRMLDGTVIDVA